MNNPPSSGALIVTSNLAFAEWTTEVFGDSWLTSALWHCLTHRCHILEFAGERYRFRQSPQNQADMPSLAVWSTDDLVLEPETAQLASR